MSTAIVWFRNDLRLNDHPALDYAVKNYDQVIPLFILTDTLLKGPHSSANRTKFLLECLEDLKGSLEKIGANLVIRDGNPGQVLKTLVDEASVSAVLFTEDYSPFSTARDTAVEQDFKDADITIRRFPGRLIINSPSDIKTRAGKTYQVFTPFFRSWHKLGRRLILKQPTHISLPSHINVGRIPTLTTFITSKDHISPHTVKGGETEARNRLSVFLSNDIHDYHTSHNDMGRDNTSRLSSYFHFGCLSPLEVEAMLGPDDGSQAWLRQLCWRDFYHYILFYYPNNTKEEFQERFRKLKWSKDENLLSLWKQGQTGYPVVDAAMRQLLEEGWMHNRARLIVGSFLTKDLWLDWRLGETHFMNLLTDGDEANNNGNWQWISSVGVDPAPLFRRLYNPSSQQKSYDPDGTYVRRYIPELKNVPDAYLAEPWKMPESTQRDTGCEIGKDYPFPVVDHAEARQHTLEQFRSV